MERVDKMAKLIDGKLISAEVLDSVRERVEYLKSRGVEPCLAVIIVGDDPASRVYVNNKKKSCEKVGIKSLEFALPAQTAQELGLPAKNVANALARARRKLRGGQNP